MLVYNDILAAEAFFVDSVLYALGRRCFLLGRGPEVSFEAGGEQLGAARPPNHCNL